MELPLYLKSAIEAELSNVKLSKISSAREKLTNDYKNQTNRPQRFINSDDELLAYLGSRLPATYAVFCNILKQISSYTDQQTFDSLLDIGTGPGTVMYAVTDNLPDIKNITLLERDKALIAKGMRIAGNSPHENVKKAQWLNKDVQEVSSLKNYDIITISYVLNELDINTKDKLIKDIWNQANKLIIIVEPGTPEGFKNIDYVREQLIKAGGSIVAPCPGEMACPVKDSDWCHFSQRIERSKYQKYLKDAEESYEDEKFSYIVFSKMEVKKDFSRIIRHPHYHKGHMEMVLCTVNGLEKTTLSKKDEIYKKARKLDWGDTITAS